MKNVFMVLPVALVVFFMFPARAAAAADDDDAREACFTAYEQGQRLRNDGKLRAAHDQLVACTRPVCPAFVRNDCSVWLAEVQTRTPAVVLKPPSDAEGKTGMAVNVFVDGVRIAERIDGRAIPVDPGPHEVRYELDGRAIDQHVVVPEGNKTFPLVVDLGLLARAPVVDTTPPANRRWLERLPTSTYVLSGVAVVGFASFAGFGLAGHSIESCAPTCTQSQVSSLRSDYVIADVSLLAALAAAGGAVYFALRSDAGASSAAPAHGRTAAAWWLGARLDGRGAVVGAGTSF